MEKYEKNAPELRNALIVNAINSRRTKYVRAQRLYDPTEMLECP